MSSLKEILRKFRAGKASNDEKKLLKKAIEEGDNRLDEILKEEWDDLNESDGEDEEMDDHWKAILQSIQNGNSRRAWPRLALAASFALLLGLTLFSMFKSPSHIEILAKEGTQVELVNLPDGSKVWLNYGSSLEYSPEGFSEERKLQLSGTAFFDIAKDSLHPFTVKATNLNVRVLGTSFEVVDFANEPLGVSVKHGLVEVKHKGSGSITRLSKNQKGIYDKEVGQFIVSAKDGAKVSNWRFDKLEYDNVEVYLVLADLSRKFGRSLRCDNPELRTKKIRATYDGKSLDSIMANLAFITDSKVINSTNNQLELKPN